MEEYHRDHVFFVGMGSFGRSGIEHRSPDFAKSISFLQEKFCSNLVGKDEALPCDDYTTQ